MFKDIQQQQQQKNAFISASYYSKMITDNGKNKLLNTRRLKLLVLGHKSE